ncbi:hypothetical protein [Altibacter sp.]|uniref:hypothetical protein n=1 Tax=Altibacter sp. TaxID=2024823 RepID=UPI000C8A7D9F|nr:hypothetical protein [Altibacter sp.]MAP54515.1 hypothetical protein [Altibacter sp.]
MPFKFHFLIILIVLPILGCRTTIPPRDSVLPTFVFKIQGDGLNENITQDFDFDNSALNLRRGQRYRVVYTGADSGGLKEMTWRLPYSNIVGLGGQRGNFLYANSGDPYVNLYRYNGFTEDPRTGASMTVQAMVTHGGPLDGVVENYEFVFRVVDFHDNSIEKTLIVRITNAPTAIVPRD